MTRGQKISEGNPVVELDEGEVAVCWEREDGEVSLSCFENSVVCCHVSADAKQTRSWKFAVSDLINLTLPEPTNEDV